MQQTLSNIFGNWNGALAGHLVGDLSAAAISATFIAPPVTAIDRAIVENASSNQPLLRTLGKHILSSFQQPRRFFIANRKPFFIVWTLYAATYSTANASDSIGKALLSTTDKAAIGTVSFISTFLVNTPLGVWKDVRFAQIYGTLSDSTTAPPSKPASRPSSSSPSSSMASPPRIAYRGVPTAMAVTFLLRDGLTIFGSFTLAPQVSSTIPDALVANPNTKTIVTQLVVPALTQVAATPVHLVGLDMCNRPDSIRLVDRLRHTRRNLPATTSMRCFRIIPAFGIGCIANIELREFFHRRLGPVYSVS